MILAVLDPWHRQRGHLLSPAAVAHVRSAIRRIAPDRRPPTEGVSLRQLAEICAGTTNGLPLSGWRHSCNAGHYLPVMCMLVSPAERPRREEQ